MLESTRVLDADVDTEGRIGDLEKGLGKTLRKK